MKKSVPVILLLNLFAGLLNAVDSPVPAAEKLSQYRAPNLYKNVKILLAPLFRQSMFEQRRLNKASWAGFRNMKNVKVSKNGDIRFKIEKSPAKLKFSNSAYQFYPEFDLSFKIKLDAPGPVNCSVWMWNREKIRIKPGKTGKTTIKPDAGKWQTVTLKKLGYMPPPEGFELRFAGPVNSQLEIKDLDVSRLVGRGFFRKEFVVPPGKIWRAVADVGNQGVLYINGKKVPSGDAVHPRPVPEGVYMYREENVNIKPYLKPGKNVIAVKGFCPGRNPYVSFAAQVVMDSGKSVTVNSDVSWKWTPKYSPGWFKPDFDTEKWRQVSSSRTGKDNAAARAFWSFNFKGRTDIPVYKGLMLIENPNDDQLYYNSARPAIFNVTLPPGLKNRNPQINYSVSRYLDGNLKKTTHGKLEKFNIAGNNLSGVIDAGKLSAGVYLLDLTLKLNGKVTETRIPEVFVVTRKIPMPEVAGNTYEEGMKLELEDTIDFTNPRDSKHPNMETDGKVRPPRYSLWLKKYENLTTPPLIVENKDMKYRETRPVSGALISYLVTFKHPGDFYLMVLDYPDDRERWMGVSCVPWNYGLGKLYNLYSKAGPLVWTGEKFQVTSRMRQLKWLYRPDPGTHSINLINLQPNSAAAASKLRIYHLTSPLPALKVPETNSRLLGIYTERTWDARGFSSTFGLMKEEPPTIRREYYKRELAGNNTNPILNRCMRFERWLDTCEAYTKYLRFTGQNLYVMGCYQYGDSNKPFTAFSEVNGSRLIPELRDILPRVLLANNINFIASIEYCFNDLLRHQDVEPELGNAGTKDMYLVDKEGKSRSFWNGRYGLNFNHPAVRKSMLNVGLAAAKKFRRLKNFIGLNWTPWVGGDWGPTYYVRGAADPLEIGYGDVTFTAFEKSCGFKLPIEKNDPGRFRKRYEIMRRRGFRERWVSWRCQQVANFYKELLEDLKKLRPNLQCFVLPGFRIMDYRAMKNSKLPLADYLSQWGFDAAKFRGTGVNLVKPAQATLEYNGAFKKRGYQCGWEMNTLPEFYEYFKAGNLRSVMIFHMWLEMERQAGALPERPKWPRPYQSTLAGQPAGDNAREVFAQTLIQADPACYFWGFCDVTMMIGNEQPLREFARVLRYLPREKFSSVDNTGLTDNIAIRLLVKGGKTYFYLVNPAYWAVTGTVNVQSKAEVKDLLSGKTAGDGKVAFKLAPYGVAAFVADDPALKFTGWHVVPENPADLDFLRDIVRSARKLCDNPKTSLVLSAADAKFMKSAIAEAEKGLKENREASAWAIVTNPRFWVLLNDYLKQAGKFSTGNGSRTKINTGKRVLKVRETSRPPALDGRLDDPVWKKAAASGGFMDSAGKPAMVNTTIRALYDKGNLYLAFECGDREPGKVQALAKKEKEINGCKDDQIAFFVKPVPGSHNYYQFAFNPAGLKFDQEMNGDQSNYAYSPPWVVRTSKTGNAWTAEVKIPLNCLKNAKAGPGSKWGFNVHRVFRLNRIPATHWNFTPGSWHDQKSLGTMEFEK